MLKFASRVDSLKGSSILEISAKAQEMKASGVDVVSLAAGEPDFNTPEPIQVAATQAMQAGITKYTPSPGFLALRKLLAEKISKENHFPVNEKEIVITAGAKHAIYLAFQCLLDPGDVVLVPTPMWVSYRSMIELAGGSFFPLPLYEEDGFHINLDRWKGLAIPPKAKGILINSPNNPTGVVFSQDELKGLAGWAMQRNLWMMSDEIYEKILYDGRKHVSLASLGPEVQNHTVTISGFSKSYCMTGWRLGWACGPASLIEKMANLQSQSNSHVTSFVQMAGITASQLPSAVVDGMVNQFNERRLFCLKRLERWKNVASYIHPEGAFYLFVNLSKWLTAKNMNDVDFCKQALMEHHVALVPGSSFGKENFIRMSYATSIPLLEKAFNRLDKMLNV